jgi:hypothetical protein
MKICAPPSGDPLAPDAWVRLCAGAVPGDGLDSLTAQVNALMPGAPFRHVLTRGGWHRLGGVVDGNHRRVHGSIVHWVDEHAAGDIDRLVTDYADAGYFATRLAGRTHYLTRSYGDAPQDFIQLEIEELRELLDRPLVEPDWWPDSVEEFLEPIDYTRVAHEPVADAFFRFRRITSIGTLLDGGSAGSRQVQDLRRLFADWHDSSAGEHATFCRHWVLALRDYTDRDGESRLTAKPVPTHVGDRPPLPPAERLRGSALANAIHGYDRQMGYPFAWFFMMLGLEAGNYTLAKSVLADQMGAYDYLPARDLKVLREWEQRPYSV